MEKDIRINEKVYKILADQLHISQSEITDDLQFGDIPQWDSLGHMSVIAALEDEFQFEIDADLIAELTNVKAICNYLEGIVHGH